MPKKQTEFQQAFRKARDAGRKTFTYKGKSYHTKTKEDIKRTKEAANPNYYGGALKGKGSGPIQHVLGQIRGGKYNKGGKVTGGRHQHN
tara:strand:- start:102 stop:368 length:267 start_codon:yes stop_codon:yes gene_type:complete